MLVTQSTEMLGSRPTASSRLIAGWPHICASMSGLTTAVPPLSAIIFSSSSVKFVQCT